MISPIHSETDSFDSAYLRNSSNCYSKFSSGVLLLEEAERAPEYLHLTIDSDVDEKDEVFENDADSEEDVVLLGEKRPTYQEITLEENEEGEVKESVIEKEKEKLPAKEVTETFYDCPNCDKSFRVESLMKFHIQMHSSVVSFNSSSSDFSPSSSKSIENQEPKLTKHKKKRHSSDKEVAEKKKQCKSLDKYKTLKKKHKSHKKSKYKSFEEF